MIRRSAVGLVAVLLAVATLAACGGKKRPPAAGTAPPAAPPVETQPSDAPQPMDTGPDVAPVDSDSFTVSDPESGEGGPLADIHFEYDQTGLTEEARGILEKHALWLQGHREARVLVEGHCDERGTAEYNLALGESRARVARDYLVGLGVDGGRLRTVSYGKERPLDPGSSETAWSRNRRAHFVVTR
jgi:peptidoglycan-associated lipoprotein